MLSTLSETVNETKVVNSCVEGIMANLTSINFATKLQGLQSKQFTRRAASVLDERLQKYRSIKVTSQVIRNDMTTEAQHRLTKRMIEMRKVKKI